MRQRSIAVVGCALLAISAGCKSGSSAPRSLSVSLVPAQIKVPIGYSVIFELKIPDEVTSGTVYWWIEGAGIGNATVGTIHESYSALNAEYDPPTAVPTQDTIVLRAALESPGYETAHAAATIQIVPAVSVTVSPSSVRLHVNEQVRFAAAVTGGTGDPTVQWAVQGPAYEPGMAGSIDATGLFTAPPVVPGGPLTIVARSVPLPMATATASAEVHIKLTVDPSPEISLRFGASQRFTATVSGSPSGGGVRWSVRPTAGDWWASSGSITYDGGQYTAPLDGRNDDVVYVEPWEDPQEAVTVLVRLVPPAVVVTGLSGAVTAARTLTVHGSGFVGEPVLRMPLADGSTLSLVPEIVSSTEVRVPVPAGATSGLVSLAMKHRQLPTTASDPFPLTRLPRLRLHPAQRDLAPGESSVIEVAFLGADPVPLAWEADVGTVAAGVYRAPDAMPADGFARVTACLSGTDVCETTVVGLHPFRIEPSAGLVVPGGSLQLSAIGASGQASASWRIVLGGGSIAADGLFTASTAVSDAGSSVVAATLGGVEERAEVGVRGAFPGLVARAGDYADYRMRPSAGTSAQAVTPVGSLAYVLASSLREDPAATQPYAWFDVYDLTTPTAPRWLGAAEAYGRQVWPPSAAGAYLLGSGQDVLGRAFVSLYDLGSDLPRLVAQDATLSWDRTTLDGDLLYALEPLPPGGDPTLRTLRVHDLRTGSLAPTRMIRLTLPTPDDPWSMAVWGDRVFLGSRDGRSLVVLGITGEESTVLGTVDALTLSAWYDLRIAGGLLFAGFAGASWDSVTGVYDLSGDLPEHVTSVPGVIAVGAHGSHVLGTTYQNGTRVFDFADPAHPRLLAYFYSPLGAGLMPAWAADGDHVLLAENAGGLGVYEVSDPGGPAVGFPFAQGGTVTAALVSGDLLFEAISDWTAPALRIIRLDQAPPVEVGRAEGVSASTLEFGGGFLYAGTYQGLEVWDVTVPTAPARTAILDMAANLLERSGDLLFAWSGNDLIGLHELVTLDVSAPSAPVRLGSVSVQLWPRAMASTGNALAIATYDGVTVVDVSTATTPVLAAHLDFGAEVFDVETAGSIAYVGTDRGLMVVDLADAYDPVVLASACPPSWEAFWGYGPTCYASVHRVAVTDDLVWSFGMQAVGWDVRDPRQPRVASLGSFGGSEIGVRGSWLYLISTGSTVGGTWPVDVSAARNVVHLLYPPDGLWQPPP